MCGADVVNEAVEAAAAAFPAWRIRARRTRAIIFPLPPARRRKTSSGFARSVTREHAKTLAEARGSVYRGIENIEYACAVATLLMGDTLENLARGVIARRCAAARRLRGYHAIQFPQRWVPMWMFPLALCFAETLSCSSRAKKFPLTS
jgi:malonate-semialdehyde dehydrogenase (acetylating)/methylmalonate-semialdehyde dehydrogenase